MYLSKKIINKIIKLKKTVAIAESCTGGLLTYSFIKNPGASMFFKYALITYSNQSKIKFLNIEKKQIDKYGAVSKQIAQSMLFNLHLKSKADLIIVTTGIAGPKGSTKNKPVGLVFIGIKFLKKNYIFKKNFKGTRIEIQKKTVQFIFNEIIKLIK
tara:strand:- start:916 stop:1383 length:468 start_codon:yes stop_codon:yes gene_type:complete